jgi:alanine or glycine:cation symporter, AGCS family
LGHRSKDKPEARSQKPEEKAKAEVESQKHRRKIKGGQKRGHPEGAARGLSHFRLPRSRPKDLKVAGSSFVARTTAGTEKNRTPRRPQKEDPATRSAVAFALSSGFSLSVSGFAFSSGFWLLASGFSPPVLYFPDSANREAVLDALQEWLNSASSFVWGPYFLIPLLLLTGFYLTVVLRGLQFRELGRSLWLALVVRREEGAEGDISHFQALMTALAATVGTGNIVGVATAIALGGPGALFWMWMTGLVGMATKYSEALLSVKFRITDPSGEQAGGPMYYLRDGIRWKPLGAVLAFLFALFASVAAFGIGNMVQSNSVADAINTSFGVPTWITGLTLAVLSGLVILGGIKSIGRFTGMFVPFMIVAYMTASGIIIIINFAEVPAAFATIFTHAFSDTAAVGGFTGAALAAGIRFGVARGIFSNESGLGSAGIAAAAAQTREPARQAFVSMTQTFIDTLVVCTFTGVAIISTGAWTSGENGVALTQLAFREGLPGNWGGWIVAASLSMFAFSTLLGWSYYGEKSIEYLLGEWSNVPYRILFVIATFFGAIYSLEFVWTLSDVMNGLMALPNLIGLLLLSGVIVKETKAYRGRRGARG